jgi:hypothetical protein
MVRNCRTLQHTLGFTWTTHEFAVAQHCNYPSGVLRSDVFDLSTRVRRAEAKRVMHEWIIDEPREGVLVAQAPSAPADRYFYLSSLFLDEYCNRT